MIVVSARDYRKSENVPYRGYDIGKTWQTKYNFKDSRDTFYNLHNNINKRYEHDPASSTYGLNKGYDCKYNNGAKSVTSQFFDQSHLKGKNNLLK